MCFFMPMKKQLNISFYFLSALFITLFVYWPGITGPFLLDDINNLKPMGDHGGLINYYNFKQFIFGNNSGALGRSVAMLSFTINDQAWPSTPYKFKYTNIFIHLLVGVSLFIFLNSLKSLTSEVKLSSGIILTCFSIWLIHPLNQSTVLYIIQRMTELSALFSLLALSCYIQAKKHSFNTSRMLLWLFAFAICSLLAIFSKENGVNILFYALVLELTLLRNIKTSQTWKYIRQVVLYLPILILIVYFISRHSYIIKGYLTRDFTLTERLFTESRVLFDVFSKLYFPPLTGFSIYHDDFSLSKSITNPITTLTSLIGIISLCITALIIRKKQPLISFAILWFFVGHILESTFIPLEIYYEHRNYIPIIGPLLLVSYYLNQITIKRFVIPLALTYISFISYQNALIWGNGELFYTINAHEHPRSFRAQTSYINKVLSKRSPEKMKPAYEELEKIFPERFFIKLHLHTLSCFDKNDSEKEINKILKMKNIKFDFNDGRRYREWSRIVESTCAYTTRQDIIRIGEYLLSNINRETSDSQGIGEIHLSMSEAYARDKNLDLAIKHLDESYKKIRNIKILKTRAFLLTTAGLYDDALESIVRAKELDKILSLKKASQKKQLERIEIKIKQAKMKSNDKL